MSGVQWLDPTSGKLLINSTSGKVWNCAACPCGCPSGPFQITFADMNANACNTSCTYFPGINRSRIQTLVDIDGTYELELVLSEDFGTYFLCSYVGVGTSNIYSVTSYINPGCTSSPVTTNLQANDISVKIRSDTLKIVEIKFSTNFNYAAATADLGDVVTNDYNNCAGGDAFDGGTATVQLVP